MTFGKEIQNPKSKIHNPSVSEISLYAAGLFPNDLSEQNYFHY